MRTPCNIAIQLTAPGAAGIAVVRVAGPGARGFLEKHFSKKAAEGRCVHGDLIDLDSVIDDAVVVACDQFTVDLNVHGGAWVVQSVLDLARREGFEIIEQKPGAPLAAEMVDAATALEREVLQYLPLARTGTGVRALLSQQRAWRELQRQAGMSVLQPSASAELERILADQTLVHLLFPPMVAIVGPANVGKSTLANQLFAQERSITADLPGTTRDWVGELANIDGLPVMLLDTPGLRDTEDPIEQAAIEGSWEQISRSQLIVLVLDATRSLSGEQEALLAQFSVALVVVNKVDLPPFGTLREGEAHAEPRLSNAGTHGSAGASPSPMSGLPARQSSPIRTVATAGHGVDELRARIVEFFCGERTIAIDRPRVWTTRQRHVVQRVLEGRGSLDEL
jgi:tRNA modification GTPase